MALAASRAVVGAARAIDDDVTVRTTRGDLVGGIVVVEPSLSRVATPYANVGGGRPSPVAHTMTSGVVVARLNRWDTVLAVRYRDASRDLATALVAGCTLAGARVKCCLPTSAQFVHVLRVRPNGDVDLAGICAN
jgi:hypothetical protein